MKEFTFLTLTFNHSLYILEHLESIKNVVISYGQDIAIDLVIADDCSVDNTVSIIQEWAETNEELFRKITIIDRNENIGTVQNFRDAVSYVSTEQFKALAGDDRYIKEDIFRVYEEMTDKIVISPVKTFGENNMEKEIQINTNHQVLINRYKKGKLYQLLNIDNFIVTPGLFIPGSYLRDEGLWNSICDFKIIEDYPMIRYFMDVCNCDFEVIDQYYIEYRLDIGVTNSNKNRAKGAYLEDLRKMHIKYHMKAFVYPKLINPYRYWLKLQRLIAVKQIKNKIN